MKAEIVRRVVEWPPSGSAQKFPDVGWLVVIMKNSWDYTVESGPHETKKQAEAAMRSASVAKKPEPASPPPVEEKPKSKAKRAKGTAAAIALLFIASLAAGDEPNRLGRFTASDKHVNHVTVVHDNATGRDYACFFNGGFMSCCPLEATK